MFSLSPAASEPCDAESWIDVSVAAVTLTFAVPVVEPTDAVTVTLPMAKGSTAPALTESRAGLELDQVAEAVRFWVLPSLKVPVAVKLPVEPRATLSEVGVIEIEVSTAGVTIRAADPETPARLADTAVVPALTPVTCPAVPVELLTVATAGIAVLH